MAVSALPNIIFLDMDGVLCTPRACVAVGNDAPYSYLDPVGCHLVLRLCVAYDARLVISSSWRIAFDSREVMEAILNAACPNLGSFIWPSKVWWRTATHAFCEDWAATSDRGREIRNWVQHHETRFDRFAILDDMGDMRPYNDQLVWCNPDDGIGLAQYHQARALLARGPL